MRVGAVVLATSQGLGYLGRWFHRAGVVHDVMVFRHGRRPTHLDWYPAGTRELVSRPFDGPAVDAWLAGVDLVLFFETPFDWGFLRYCRDRGKPTVIVGMYECTPERPPHQPTAWVSPSRLDQRYFPDSPYIPVPVPPEVDWRQRTRALTFLHNAGNLGLKGRNGTVELIEAWGLLRCPARLTVRCQDRDGLLTALRGSRCWRAAEARGPDCWSLWGDRLFLDCRRDGKPHSDLFAEHDVYIAPEKHNGLSLPLQEARAAGMLVVTTNRFPHNDWLPRKLHDPKCDHEPDSDRCGCPGTLIPVTSTRTERVSGGCNVIERSYTTPQAIARTVEGLYGAGISEYSRSGNEYRKDMSWAKLGPVWAGYLRSVVEKGVA